MKGEDGEQKSARRATPSFLRWGSRGVAWLRAGECALGCWRYFAYVGGCLPGSGVRAWRLVRGDLGERCACSGLACGVFADFKRAVHESLAKRIRWPGDRGRAWVTKALVGQFGENAVRICSRMSALGETEEAQSSTGCLLRR
jgi:hypothetical protein